MKSTNKRPIIPVNFENSEALFKVMEKSIYEYENDISPDSLEVNLGEMVLSPVYFLMWSIKARYKHWGGAKNNGKSLQGAFRVTTKWLSNPNRHVVVMRRHANLNVGSTLKDVLKVMNLMADFTGIEQLRPVSADDYRKSGGKELFVYNKTNDIKLENKVTGTMIHFTGLDRLAQGGFSLDNPKHAIDTIWADEMVDIATDLGSDMLDDSTFTKWQVAESTVFRGTYDARLNENGKMEQFRRPGLEWVDEEVIFTYNAHNPSHWQIKDFLDKFVPLNPLDKEDCYEMRMTRTRMYHDPDYMNGKGLFVARVSAYINNGRDIDLIEQLRKTNFTEWAYLYLGATKSIGGLAYSGLESYLIIDTLAKESVVPISIGIDHANSETHKDYFAVSFLATSLDTGMYGDDYTGGVFPSYQFKYYYDEMGHSNMKMKFKTDEELAQMVMERLIKHVDNYEPWEHHISVHGLAIVVDYNAGSFMQTMFRIWQNFAINNPHMPWLRNIKIVPCDAKNKQMVINGTKQNARYGRVERNKVELENRMIIIDPKCFQTKTQFLGTAYGTKKTQYGEEQIFVIDKDRDWVDAMDYAVMVRGIADRFEQVLLLKRNMKKRG